MSFIGIIAEKKEFGHIKNALSECIGINNKNVMHINLQSIENLQNVKFETIIINQNLEKLKEHKEELQKISKSANYMILNSDIKLGINLLENHKINIITYGLNQKATVTISSVSQTGISIYLQRNIKNKENQIVEMEERHIKRKEKSEYNIYEILIIYIMLILYGTQIMHEI